MKPDKTIVVPVTIDMSAFDDALHAIRACVSQIGSVIDDYMTEQEAPPPSTATQAFGINGVPLYAFGAPVYWLNGAPAAARAARTKTP